MEYWDLFMDTCFGEERIKLEKAIGDAFLFSNYYQKRETERLCILVGPPGSGKTTLLDMIRRMTVLNNWLSIWWELCPMERYHYPNIFCVLREGEYVFSSTNDEHVALEYENSVIVHTTGTRVDYTTYVDMKDTIVKPASIDQIVQHCISVAKGGM